MKKAIRGLIALAAVALFTVVMVKLVGDRHHLCEGKPASCLDGN